MKLKDYKELNSMEHLESIVNPDLLPILPKDKIYSYMTHRYTSQKDITYGKAENYVNNKKIFDIQCNSDASVFIAKSFGGYSNTYSCRLCFTNKLLTSFSCNCPSYVNWHTLCKHLIGVMISIERHRQNLLLTRSSVVKNSLNSQQYIYTKNIKSQNDREERVLNRNVDMTLNTVQKNASNFFSETTSYDAKNVFEECKIKSTCEIDLKSIFEKYPDCITNGEKLKAFLDDLYPRESKAVKKVLSTMVNDGIAKEIRESSDITDIRKSQWKRKLEDDYGWSEKIIITCIDMFIGKVEHVRVDGSVKSECTDIVLQRQAESSSAIDGRAIDIKKTNINVVIKTNSTDSNGVVSKDKNGTPTIKSSQIVNTATEIHDSSHSFEIKNGVLFKYKGTEANVIIPENVTSIGNNAFSGLNGLMSVIIHDNVTYIGSSAFRDCRNLESAIIPDKVTAIGYTAFYGCNGLVNVMIPRSVISIGNSVFRDCTKLQEIHFKGTKAQWGIIKKGNKYLKDTSVKQIVCSDGVVSVTCGNKTDASKKCKPSPKNNISLGSVVYTGIDTKDKNKKTIVKSSQTVNELKPVQDTSRDFEITNGVVVKYLGYAANVTIPKSVTSIGGKAFYGCSTLQSIAIPKGVTSICYSAFGGCKWLTNVTIPDSVLSIGSYAFCGCEKLTNITIPYGVTSIESNVFRGCSGLTSITIPNSVTCINNSAFYGCSGLTSITIPNSVISINYYAFNGCTKLQTIRFGGTEAQWERMQKGDKYLKDTAVKEIVCSDGVVSIFFKNRTVASKKREPSSNDNINFGSTEFEVYSFKDKNKKTIAKSSQIINDVKPVQDTSRDFEITNGVVVKYMGHAVNVTIPRSVTSIGKRAFKCNVGKKNTSVLNACEQIKKVVVSEGVTHIKEMAFQGCPKLKIIQFSEGLRVIGYSAFKNCKKLKKITLPVSVHYIGEMAFCGCKSLRKIRFNGTVQQWSHIRKEKDYLQDSSVKKVICSDGKVLINNL